MWVRLHCPEHPSTPYPVYAHPHNPQVAHYSHAWLLVCPVRQCLQEFLKKPAASLAAYSKGVENAVRYLGADHGITVTLKKSEAAARTALDATSARKKSATASRT